MNDIFFLAAVVRYYHMIRGPQLLFYARDAFFLSDLFRSAIFYSLSAEGEGQVFNV